MKIIVRHWLAFVLNKAIDDELNKKKIDKKWKTVNNAHRSTLKMNGKPIREAIQVMTRTYDKKVEKLKPYAKEKS